MGIKHQGNEYSFTCHKHDKPKSYFSYRFALEHLRIEHGIDYYSEGTTIPEITSGALVVCGLDGCKTKVLKTGITSHRALKHPRFEFLVQNYDHHGIADNSYHCPENFCTKFYDTKELLNQHLTRWHQYSACFFCDDILSAIEAPNHYC
ncbi:uncharacterized protein KGF55_004528 [Candida pseudojiufengensis]|uniref:uncharacterized protein n=1 Tax=Candida pseudojiufengensis TaxID=497109 RepID=UPI0022259A24|nr:uncharacterized protein KGF55_004528 [Candida pseudojiufengensis]KAI5960635.1 hypothetical protein KGF55_004528 [Candida pseudojiufengensis]